MCGGQIIDAPPAHLKQDEGDDEHPKGQTLALTGELAVVDVDEVGEPGDGSPRFLGIPRPVVPPGFLGPEGAEKHADGEERKAYIDEIVGNVHF